MRSLILTSAVIVSLLPGFYAFGQQADKSSCKNEKFGECFTSLNDIWPRKRPGCKAVVWVKGNDKIRPNCGGATRSYYYFPRSDQENIEVFHTVFDGGGYYAPSKSSERWTSSPHDMTQQVIQACFLNLVEKKISRDDINKSGKVINSSEQEENNCHEIPDPNDCFCIEE